MELRLHNTLTREKEPPVFEPIDPANVRLYVCGPTVYDFAHIGNARPVIVFDVLYRLLRHIYGEGHVKYVRNITDVEDKITARARQDYPSLSINDAIRKVTEKTEQQFHEDADALGNLRPDVEPRATEHIREMREIIETLVKRDFAYVAEDHVLFSPDAMNAANQGAMNVGNERVPRYGELSRNSLDEMIAGARVDVAPYKRSLTDFVLWKPSTKGEPSWQSPAGIKVPGRPGWHIECSAMAWKHLGKRFDIHGGGADLVFPHHENEIAQTCCAFHTNKMASVWMHNGFLRVEGAKMSKSLGNFRTIAELREDWQGEVIRYQMLMTHYRQPLDWTEWSSREAQFIVDRWYELFSGFESLRTDQIDPQVLDALSYDLNTPAALARLSVLYENAKKSVEDAKVFIGTAKFLGFFRKSADEYFSFYKEVGGVVPKSSPIVPVELQKARDAARAAKDFERADYIRNIIYLYGYRVADGPGSDSQLVPAERDFFSISTNARAKLAAAVQSGMSDLESTDINDLGFEAGLTLKFGHIFRHTDEFNYAVEEAFSALTFELGSGAITREDLRSTIIDVLLSNLATPAKFGADVVAGAALFKLLSGVVKQFEVFLENQVVVLPVDTSWRIGDVEVFGADRAKEEVREINTKLERISSFTGVEGSNFRVTVESSSAAMAARATMMVRAFITATRFLMSASADQANLFMPPTGAHERGIEEDVLLKVATSSSDSTIIVPGKRGIFPYRLSRQFIDTARQDPLHQRLSTILSLERFVPVRKELLALDQLCRARRAIDPFARLLWNVEAVRTVCKTDENSGSLRDIVDRVLSTEAFSPKDRKSLLRQSDRLVRLRDRPSVVGDSDALASQHFAENVVLMMIIGSHCETIN